MFTVMTWNVENLFSPTESQQSAFDAKVDALAEIVTAQAPDLLGVQEIGDPAAFDTLRRRLGPGWTGVLSTHFEPDHTIRVGWLAPTPMTHPEEVVDLPPAIGPVQVEDDGTTMTTLGRGALAVTATTPGGTPVRALTAHLKSKLLSFPGGRFDTRDERERARYAVYALHRRAAEAAAVRYWATASLEDEFADGAVLVCGDLNDTLDAATTQLVYGPPGSQIGTPGFDAADRGDAQRLFALGYAMTPPDDYSRVNQGRRELIDHILVSHTMVRRLVSAGAVAVDDLPDIGLHPRTQPRAAGSPSDHRPVVARFDL